MGFVWYATNLTTSGERLVAMALADWADDFGRCWPSLATIADKTGMSRRNAQRVVKNLVEIGYITILVPSAPKRTPLYQLHPDALARPEERPIEAPLPLMPQPEEGRHPVTPEVTPSSSRGDARVTLSVIDTPTIPQPSLKGTVAGDVIRPRNLGWDALVELFEYEPEGSEQALWGRIAKKANATSDPRTAIQGRALGIINQWGAKSLTPASLDKWWDRFGTRLGQATDQEEQRMRSDLEQAQRRERAAQLENEREIGR